MTLVIEIHDILELPFSDAFVAIEGSQAGTLTTPRLGPKQQKFDPPLKIICSQQDLLTFKFCNDQQTYQSEGISVLKAEFFAPLFIKKYAKDSAIQTGIQSTIQFSKSNSNEETDTIMHCTITYDRMRKFQGQLCLVVNKYKGEKKKLYRGKCPSKNLFSFLDAEEDRPRWKKLNFLEKIYMDDD